jgi:hypothetical protein
MKNKRKLKGESLSHAHMEKGGMRKGAEVLPASKKSLLHCNTPTVFFKVRPFFITSYSFSKNLKTLKSWKWASPDNEEKQGW